MLSAVEIQNLQDQIEALDDEALIAEARRLRGLATGIRPKLVARWDEMISEAVGDLQNPLRFARRQEARGRLRGFCLARRKHDWADP